MVGLHCCVGVYLNEQYKVNTVCDENLESNIKYNEFWRPGRFYFVDGTYVCGGLLKELHQREFIDKWEKKIKRAWFEGRFERFCSICARRFLLCRLLL